MGASHKVLDKNLAFFLGVEAGAVCTNWTFGSTYPSAVVDLGLYPDLPHVPEIWIDIPGFVAGSSGTLVLILYGGTTATAATTTLWTSRTYTAAEAKLIFDTNDFYRLPVPVGDLITGTTQIRSLKLGFAIGTATPTAGAAWAGMAPALR